MKKWLLRLSLLAGLTLAHVLLLLLLNAVEAGLAKPHRLVFSLPLPAGVLEKAGITQAELDSGVYTIERVTAAGFFSDWDPDEERYRMRPLRPSGGGAVREWAVDVPLESGDNQYKFALRLVKKTGEKTLLWCQNVKASRQVADGYGGLNSVYQVPSIRTLRFIENALLLGLMIMMVVFLLLDPLLSLIMHFRLSFPVKLVLNMGIALVVSGAAFIVYNILETRTLSRQAYIEFTALAHQVLLSDGVDFRKLSDPAEKDRAAKSLQSFFLNFRARIELSKYSLRQSTVGNIVLFGTDYRPAAWSMRKENAEPMLRAAAESKNDIAGYFRNVRFRGLLEAMKTGRTSDAPVFGNADTPFVPGKQDGFYRLLLGYDCLLIPIRERGETLGYYGLTIYPELLGRELLRILIFNLLLLPIIGLLAWLLYQNIGKNVHRQLAELTDWTQAILRGDFGMEKKISTHDELEELAENFDQMRMSLGRNMHNLQLINIVTGFLQRITDIEELYKVFITFVTADYGFTFNRAAVFLREGDHIVGRYAVGSIDEQEIIERFGSMQEYISFKMDIQTFLKDYKHFLSRMDGRFSEAVKTISIPADAELSAFWNVFNTGTTAHFEDTKSYRSESDRNIRDLLHLGEADLLPLIKGGVSVGVLLVDNRFSGKPILSDQVNQLQIILNDFAVNLENASIVRNLEKIVEERTHELELQKARVEEKTVELESERNVLKTRNEIMEYELEMARKIQMQMIPTKCPIPTIAFFYRPMDKVGGDFFDFIEYTDGRIGIFLSDVSGHGVPAAFITSMIKTILIQIAPFIKDPANMLTYLNNSMMNQTGENFVTAFFGIFDPDNREFTFSNAGHNSPFLVTRKGSTILKPKQRGVPLAVLSSSQMEKRRKTYTNETIVLEKDSKLLLYTDGLTEAVHIDAKLSAKDSSDFENGGLLDVMTRCSGLSSMKFVEAVVKNLVEFRGSDKFDDDICLICIDSELPPGGFLE